MSQQITCPPSRSKQFTLRDLFAVMTLLCILAATGTYSLMALIVFTPLISGVFLYAVRLLGNLDHRGLAMPLVGWGTAWMFLCALLLPVADQGRGPSRRSHCTNNLKQLMLAIQNYESTYSSLPARCTFDEQSRPAVSWRVSLLPFIEDQALYNSFACGEAWDSPHNLPLADRRPSSYHCPSSKRPGRLGQTATDYFAAAGPDTVWEDGTQLNLASITDGTSNTVMLVESHDTDVIWSQPRDLDLTSPDRPSLPRGRLSGNHSSRAQVAMADGSVTSISSTIDPEVLKQLANRRDGKPVPGSWDQ